MNHFSLFFLGLYSGNGHTIMDDMGNLVHPPIDQWLFQVMGDVELVSHTYHKR